MLILIFRNIQIKNSNFISILCMGIRMKIMAVRNTTTECVKLHITVIFIIINIIDCQFNIQSARNKTA
jgi:hypothetical protein